LRKIGRDYFGMTGLSRLFLVLALLMAGGTAPRAQDNPMAAPVLPVPDAEPEEETPAPGPAAPAGVIFPRVFAPLPPVRPGAAHARKAAEPAREAVPALPEEAPPPPAAPGFSFGPFRIPDLSPPSLTPPAEPSAPDAGNEGDPAMALPTLAVPPQASTTEEIEAEEARTPEPAQVEKQTDSVNIACLKPEVLTLIRQAGEHFRGTPVITSGQRDRGRRGSYHRRCMAADFFVPGVERATLAKYLRGLPGAGGVGTYCHTKSVHIDSGEARNWHQCGFRFRFAQR
jgi:Peptidase M15